MRKFLDFLTKLQWLGLIGLLGSILGNAYLKLFWLFFLLGFIGIFRNIPAFCQSLLQIISYPVIFFGHRFRLPSKESYVCKTDYILPFEGQWYAANGGVDRKTSHSWGVWPQRYAYDFVILDENEKTFSGDSRRLQDYYCYGRDILAPADGVVVKVAGRRPDSRVYGDGSVECRAGDIRGNFITIRHNENEYSTIAHIMPDSISVRKGQRVLRGQAIAKCGNSGNTSEPHVHFQLNDGRSFFASAGLPIRFGGVLAKENGIVHPEEYITKGQWVHNTSEKQGTVP